MILPAKIQVSMSPRCSSVNVSISFVPCISRSSPGVTQRNDMRFIVSQGSSMKKLLLRVATCQMVLTRSVRTTLFRVQHFAHLLSEAGRRERLLQEGDRCFKDAVADDGVVGVAGREQHLHA